jgi:multidrug efflux pump subunit AcrB
MLAVLIVLMGGYAILNTATDIFPNIKIPIAAVIWRYNGILPEEIANRIVLFSERVAQTTVNDVEHTESQSVLGTSVVKYFFQPGVDQDLSMSQITAVSQVQLGFSPPGTTPPFVLSYNASTVPILQLAMTSSTLPEATIYDLTNTILRTQLATVAGASAPYPFGGKQRQVQVDLDPQALRANGLSADDVVAAIGAQNLILPAGTEKIGALEYFIKLNASPLRIEELNDLPIRARNGTVTYIRDVGHVRDGYSPQTNIVRVEGQRAVLMNVLKTGKASTIDIINGINDKLPQARASLPPELKIEALSDQSVFVRAAISGVIREALIAGALTGLLILLFLGSWRSTLIITISIPLSILASICCLAALGETINIMTLGGLALAVGILVDDATVTIENINYHLNRARMSNRQFSTARIRLPCLRSFPRCRFASYSCRCSCWQASPSFYSFRWRRRSCSPCWPHTCCRGPWCRHSPSSGSKCMTLIRLDNRDCSDAFSSASSGASSDCARVIMNCYAPHCAAARVLPRLS